MELSQFKETCIHGFCLRKTFKSKKCLENSKQESCYQKYIKQLFINYNKNQEKDEEWEKVKREIWKRDKGDLVENAFTNELITVIRKKWFYLYKKLDGIYDCMHLLPRSSHPEFKYDVDNIILGKRFYHSFIDKSLDLISGKYVKGNRERIITLIMQKNGRWEEGYDYEQFKRDKEKSIRDRTAVCK